MKALGVHGFIDREEQAEIERKRLESITKTKVVTIIPSFNRYENLVKILNQLSTENSLEKNRIIVIDDCSSDERYHKLKTLYPNVKFLKNKKNNGKKEYWVTVNRLFKQLKKYNFEYVLQLDDDFELCTNIVDRLLEIANNNPKNVAYYFVRNQSSSDRKGRWGFSNYVDGGAFYKRSALESLNFKINSIPKSRWKVNPKLSSGVWQQVTVRLHSKFKNPITKTKHSLVEHIGYNSSKMNPFRNKNIKEQNKVKTKNFIEKNNNI